MEDNANAKRGAYGLVCLVGNRQEAVVEVEDRI
jgi:hypothetical protein